MTHDERKMVGERDGVFVTLFGLCRAVDGFDGMLVGEVRMGSPYRQCQSLPSNCLKSLRNVITQAAALSWSQRDSSEL